MFAKLRTSEPQIDFTGPLKKACITHQGMSRPKQQFINDHCTELMTPSDEKKKQTIQIYKNRQINDATTLQLPPTVVACFVCSEKLVCLAWGYGRVLEL